MSGKKDGHVFASGKKCVYTCLWKERLSVVTKMYMFGGRIDVLDMYFYKKMYLKDTFKNGY